MKHINSIKDLEPQAEGFFNRGAESINIIGNVFEDILNSFGDAISGITNQATSRQNTVDLSSDKFGVAPFKQIIGKALPQTPGFIDAESQRVERFVEHNPRDI